MRHCEERACKEGEMEGLGKMGEGLAVMRKAGRKIGGVRVKGSPDP